MPRHARLARLASGSKLSPQKPDYAPVAALGAFWFGLIGISTVLTYQHHLLDVAGGLLLGTLCCYVIAGPREAPEATITPRIAAYYGLGAAALPAFAMLCGPWGGLLLWPSLSLGLVAAGYLGVGPAVFRKDRGRIPLSARLVLAPCLLGHWISLLYYRRQCHPWDPVAPNLLIGRRLNDEEAKAVVQQGATAVLDLTAESSEAGPLLGTSYRNIPILDLTGPTPEQMKEAVSFIERHVRSGVVYVHCKAGFSRSAAVVGAYLLAAGKTRTAEETVAFLREVRPGIVVRPEALEALKTFQASLRRRPAAPPWQRAANSDRVEAL